MPTTSSPLASDVLVNSLIKMEQQSSIAGAGDPILHFPPALQISPAGAMQALTQPSSSSSVASVPHLLLSQQQPVLPPPSLPTVGAVAGAVAAAAAGTGDEDCKVKLEIDDLFPSVPSWDETGPTSASAAAAAAIASTAPPAFLTVTMPSLSTTNAATSTVVKTVRIPSLQHSISVPADVEAALKLPQVPATSSSSSSASALNLNALRPQPPHPVPSAALASAGLRIAIPQSADTTTSAVGGGLAPPTTPSPAGSSSIASPPAVAAIATAASASSTTKKTVFTAKGKKSFPWRSHLDLMKESRSVRCELDGSLTTWCTKVLNVQEWLEFKINRHADRSKSPHSADITGRQVVR